MSVNRRAFVTQIIALSVAPAIVRASSLMPIKPLRPLAWSYTRWVRGRNGLFAAPISIETRETIFAYWNSTAEPMSVGTAVLLPGQKRFISDRFQNLSEVRWVGRSFNIAPRIIAKLDATAA